MESLNDGFQQMQIRKGNESSKAKKKPSRWDRGYSTTPFRRGLLGKENLPKSASKSSSGGYRAEKNRNSAPGRFGVLKDDANSSPRIYTLELVGGIKSIEKANDIRDACLKNESVLSTVLEKIRLHSADEEEPSVNNYSVEIIRGNEESSIVLKLSRKVNWYQKNKLLEMFSKSNVSGFTEWLAGAKGWRFEISEKSWKKRFVVQLNTLQSVFTLVAPDEQKYFFVSEKKRMVWRKHDELTEIVSDIRVWMETLTPSDLTHRMLRSSNNGPDSPVHWAHHHPVSHHNSEKGLVCIPVALTSNLVPLLRTTCQMQSSKYPLTVVTERTMLELVVVSIQSDVLV